MCEVRSKEKRAGTKKKEYNGQQQKEMDCHEPHPVPNEKTQPIQWTERPTGALVAVNSLWPTMSTMRTVTKIYTKNKVFNINERATSKRDSKWMGEERKCNGCWGGRFWNGVALERL